MISSHVMTASANIEEDDVLALDMERLSALPESWRGLDPTSIAESVVETLLDMLQLDFVGLRFNDSDHVFLRVSEALEKSVGVEGVRASLRRRPDARPRSGALASGAPASPVTECQMGSDGSIGVILASADRPGFPDRSELARLKLAAFLAGLSCREMREISDRKPPVDLREKPSTERGLIESEWRLHLTINTIPAMAWSTTPDGLIDFCNQTFVDYVGWSAEELSGQGFWPIFHPDDAPHLLAAWQEIMASKRPRDVEGRLRRADGEYRWFVLRQNPLFDEDGNIVKWYGAGTDIEDRKRADAALAQAQAALLASQQNLDLIINSLPVLIWSARPDGSADFVNESWSDYAGKPAQEILEWGFLPLYHPDDVEGMVDIWKRDLEKSDRTSIKGRIRGADGQYRWFYFAGRKLTDANGVVRWFGCNIDIEDLQRSEDALRASEAALRASEQALSQMLDAIPGMAWSTTAEGYADKFNKQFIDFTGISAEDLIGTGFLAQFHPDDVDRMFAEWQLMMAAKVGGDIEGRARRADGEYRWLICRCSPILNADGDVVRWYGVNLDIDDRKRAEQALVTSERNFSLILNSLPVLVWSAQEGGSADFVNTRYLDYVGRPIEDILEYGFASVIHPDDVDQLLRIWSEAQSGDRSLAQARIRRSDGTYRWFMLSGVKLVDASGAVKWFGVNVDIDDLKCAEAALRENEAALRDSERRLRLTVGTIPAMVWSARPDGMLDSWNQAFLDFSGVTFDEIEGDGHYKLFHPDDTEHLRSTWNEVVASKRPKEVEGRMRSRDGEYRWFTFRQSPLLDDDGNVLKWYGIVVDIEDSKRAEAALKESEIALRGNERQLQQIITSIPGLPWSSDEHGATTFWSQQYLDYAGATMEDVLGYGFVNYIHPDDRARTLEHWAKILTSGEPGEAELRLRRADGVYRWFLIRACPFFDDDGKLTQWFGVSVDIEDRKVAQDSLLASEAALRESERQLQQIVSSIPGLTWRSDVQGNITYWSQSFFDYAGEAAEANLGFGFLDFVHPDDRDRVLETWVSILRTGTSGESEARLRRADGEYRWFLWRANPFVDDAGKITQWFGINIDIENRKRAEESLRQAQNDLAHATRLTTMGELAVSIAHEVNQPLMAVVTNAGACLRWLADSKTDIAMARQAAERIVQDGHRAGDIIKSLRNLARKSSPKLERVSLDQVIKVVLDLMQGELRRHDVTVKTEFSECSIAIMGDSTQLQQVVLNLLMNALDALAGGGTNPKQLGVRAEACDGQALVSITDNGSGLDTNDPERVFEAFFSTKAEGIGMGLSICRSIIEAHGGKIWATNNKVRGSIFSFTLPLAEG